MRRDQLEHIIRACADIAEDSEIVVVGSQAILGQYPNAPEEMLISMEADVFPKNRTDMADMIDGAIGEASMFHQTFGYYPQGLPTFRPILPAGWEQRLVAVRNANTRWATGWCLEAHDIVVSKLIAGRDKDFRYAPGGGEAPADPPGRDGRAAGGHAPG